jgi:hypothetical protein
MGRAGAAAGTKAAIEIAKQATIGTAIVSVSPHVFFYFSPSSIFDL